MESKKAIVDWALIISTLGLLLGLFSQTVRNYERLTKIETIVQDEVTLCDCYNTRAKVGVLEHRIQVLEQRLDRMGN